MTLQEKELLTRFLQQLAAAQAAQKDAEADSLIREACARQPDASYLLAQRAIQLEQLLQASQSEVAKLQAERGRADAGSGGGFLNENYSWGSRPPAPAASHRAQVAPASTAAPVAGRGGGWGSGLFGNIATTAAGVVAGSFLFQGIQGLMNRGDASSTASTPDHMAQAAAQEPELLNSFDTAESGNDDSFLADADGGGDFA